MPTSAAQNLDLHESDDGQEIGKMNKIKLNLIAGYDHNILMEDTDLADDDEELSVSKIQTMKPGIN